MDIDFNKVFATRRILVIDDMDAMRQIEKSCLTEAGFEHINTVVNGQLALEYLKVHKVDIIICDWDMPDVTGIEVLEAVRADEKLKDTLFIMVTAETRAKNIKQAVAAGATDYLLKPFKTDQLVYRVLKALRKLEK